MNAIARQHPSRAQWLRRLALRRKDRIAFVLSGGGPLGALQVGALGALFEHGVRPDLVVGSSVGALNATFTAFDPTFEGTIKLEEIWRGLRDEDLFPGSRFKASWARFLVRGNRVFENTGIKRLVETRMGAAKFEDAQIPFGVVTTELLTGTSKVFTSGDILQPLLASTAMPGILPPVEIEGRSYIDGGVSDNVPISPAVAMGARTVYVLNSTSHTHQQRPLQRPMDYLLHAFTLARGQRVGIEQSLYGEKVRLVVLPLGPIDFYVSFASMDHTGKLIELGYQETRKFLSGRAEAVVEESAAGSVEVIAPPR